MKPYLGVDVGTSGCRVVAYAEGFRLLAETVREYPTLSPRPGWAEQDPEVVVGAVVSALREILARPELGGERPAAVGLASVMHSLLALDGEGRPLTNALIWADLRSAPQAERLRAEGRAEDFYRRTGCPVHPMYLPAKVRWLAEQAPETWAAAHRLVTLKDYLIWRLTGRFVLDQSSASATGLLNEETLGWDKTILDAVGLAPDHLSEPVDPLTILDGFTTAYCREQGLPFGVPLVVGASDGVLSNPGAGAVLPGQLAVMIGTSAAVRVVSNRPVLDPQARTWCYYLLPGRWVPGGAANNGGNILQWYRDRFAVAERAEARARGLDPFTIVSEQAAAVPPGSRGLVFLPFLAGERSPGWDPHARGALFGLNLGHGRNEVVRAILEGVAYQLFSIYEALVETVGRPAEVRAAGGFTRSPAWLQIVADTFGVPLLVPEVAEGSAFGAAALAMLATGALERLEDVARFLPPGRTVEPDSARTAVYRELYGLYLDLYRKLGPEFARLSAFQSRTAPAAGPSPAPEEGTGR
jgi:gluconokinase